MDINLEVPEEPGVKLAKLAKSAKLMNCLKEKLN